MKKRVYSVCKAESEREHMRVNEEERDYREEEKEEDEQKVFLSDRTLLSISVHTPNLKKREEQHRMIISIHHHLYSRESILHAVMRDDRPSVLSE